MNQDGNKEGLKLVKRGPVWKVKVALIATDSSVETKNWKIKVILN